MKNSTETRLIQLFKLSLLLVFLVLGCSQVWGGDASFNIFYTQYAYGGVGPSVGIVALQYTYSTNGLILTGNTTLISGVTNPNFGGADGILINSNNNNLLIAGGGGAGVAGIVYQITQAGAQGNPFSVTMNPATTAYNLTIVPANGAKSGLSAGTLLAMEKDYGYGHISIFPLSPNLATGTAYPVTGDDTFVTGVAFGPDGTAYYGSGTETSNAGNFGTITFDGVEFITHRLFGSQLANGNYPPGGVIYTGTHRLSFDPYTGDIFTVGGTTVGQYDPGSNAFHILSLYNPANGFELSTPVADGNGHLLITSDGSGDLAIVDYAAAPGRLIDASSGIQYSYTFLAANLAAVAIGSSSSGAPVIGQQPQNATAIVGQTATFSVTATGSGLTYQWQSAPAGGSTFSPIPGATSSSYTTPPTSPSDSGTQFLCVVTSNQTSANSGIATLTVLTSSTNYVTSASLGTLRNNYSGWVGMSISVGKSPLTVTSLGRMFAVGNTGTHTVKIVSASTGADVPGASASVIMSGGVPGQFMYANLPASVTLSANTSYYILTQETAQGDEWYDWDSIAQTTSVANLAAAEWGLPYTAVGQSSGHVYGPVDFKYSVGVLVTVAPATATLSNSGTQQFSATVTGTSNQSVTWSINPAAGTITTSGAYMAPTGITGNQAVTVTATSVASSTALGSATVNLIPPAPPMITQQPQSATVAVGGTATFTVVASSALTYQWESELSGGSLFNPIAGATSASYTTPAAALTDSGTQFICIVTNNQGSVQTNAATLTVASGSNFISSFVLGTARNNYSGWVGMAINVGNAPVTVTSLGRMVLPGNSGTHALKIVNASTGADVVGSLTSVNTSDAPSGSFVYASLTNSVVLQANTGYYVMAQETFGGDQWYDLNTSLQSSAVATITAPVYSSGSSYITVSGLPGHSYGPLDFRYTMAAVTTSSFVTSITPGSLRNDFTGWVGASITTGANSVTVTQLGHFCVSGNTGTHTVKIVNASTGADLPGGSVSINLAGGQPGAFVYVTLASPIALSPHTTYDLVSQETAGGDQWYDFNATVTTNAVASDTASVWAYNGAPFSAIGGSANHMYVLLDFVYELP